MNSPVSENFTLRAAENPFRSERVLQMRYRLEGVTRDELLARCERLGYRAALIGPHGSGKTTLLEDLQPHLHARGFSTRFIRLSEEQRRFASGFAKNLFADCASKDIVLFDGAEQLSWPAWRCFLRLSRSAGGLIITTHRSGRLPTLWECRTSPELLASIAAELLAVKQEAMRSQAEQLFARHRGNVRDALREWYDLAAG